MHKLLEYPIFVDGDCDFKTYLFKKTYQNMPKQDENGEYDDYKLHHWRVKKYKMYLNLTLCTVQLRIEKSF